MIASKKYTYRQSLANAVSPYGCYNGNVASRTWSEGTYRYSYDTMNRLTAAQFVPTEEASARPGIEQTLTPDFSTYYGYDERSNITDIVRHGVTDMMDDIDCIETFGTLDEIVCTYEGNQLRSMTAMSEALPFNGITGLHTNGDYEMTYNAAGDLVRDPSRGVLRTQWNADGHPSQYDLEGGHRHRLGWDNTGNHLYTSYETSVTTVSAGQLPGRTRRTALRAYTGDGHVLCGGEGNSIADSIEMIRFDGGYFDADLVPHYYIADYLDSNIAVVDADGDLVQTATYYPYGEPHRNPLIRRGIHVSAPSTADAATAAEPRTTNPFLYGDKEWMCQDGLREYVYGARMHVPSLPRFTSIDPLAEKHPEQTPYLFCAANPIRYVDESGRDYHVKVDTKAQTITISADYYAFGRDRESIQSAIAFWNDRSGKYTMDGYTVNFELTYHEVNTTKEGYPPKAILNEAIVNDGKSGTANAYIVYPDLIDKEDSSKVYSGHYYERLIEISEKHANEHTGAHEVGHSLGLIHSNSGLMYPNNSRDNVKISTSEIITMIKNAFTGIVAKDENGAEPGQGHLDNKEVVKSIKWKYNVKETDNK